MTRDEVLAAARAQGVADLADVAAVVLETDGSISVVPRTGAQHGASTLTPVQQLE